MKLQTWIKEYLLVAQKNDTEFKTIIEALLSEDDARQKQAVIQLE